MRLALAIAAFALSFSTTLSAQHMNASASPCRQAATNAKEADCFYDAWKIADYEMNLLYSAIQNVRGPADIQKLKTAQRLWLKFRDADCSAERALYAGGSAAPAVFNACMEAETRQRTAELKTMYGWIIEKNRPAKP